MSVTTKPLPTPLLRSQALAGGDEPMVLSSPTMGRSDLVKVRKQLHDALEADPASIGAHVIRLRAQFDQGKTGRRVVSLRIDLGEDFPNLPLETLPARLEPMSAAGHARCDAVLGPEFQVLSIFFGGKKLR